VATNRMRAEKQTNLAVESMTTIFVRRAG